MGSEPAAAVTLQLTTPAESRCLPQGQELRSEYVTAGRSCDGKLPTAERKPTPPITSNMAPMDEAIKAITLM